MVCDTGSAAEENIPTNSPVLDIMAHDGGDCEEIIRDYVLYRLRIAGHIHGNGPQDNPTAEMRTMRRTGQQFEAAYLNAEQVDMTRDINVNGPEQNVIEALESISTELFENGINWGRIVGFVVLASKIALKGYAYDRPQVSDVVIIQAAAHLRTERFSSWINAHGGWDGFKQHFNRRENGNLVDEEFSWGKAATFGIATLAGAAAVVNFFMQKS